MIPLLFPFGSVFSHRNCTLTSYPYTTTSILEIRVKEIQREKNVEARRLRMRQEASEKARKRAEEIGIPPLPHSSHTHTLSST